MMKRKLIEISQDDLIVCDNKSCDFKIKNESGDANEDISHYLNMPCPKCGENLLTDEDYKLATSFMKGVNFINKWFSWLAYIIPRKKHKKDDLTKVKVHKGIHIYENKNTL